MINMKYSYTFIIPHKNCPGLLRRCVDSIPERDDVQIIVVDDNSDDGKKPSLPDRRGLEIVLLNVSQSNGAGKARNVGLGKATGKWLLFPDSDDYYVEGFLDVLDQHVHTNIDIVYFNFEYRDGNTGELLPRFAFGKFFDEFDGGNKMSEEIRLHHNVPWTKMIRRGYVQHYQFRFEEVIIGNDMLFSILVGYFTNNIAVEKSPLYVYLRNGNSITTKKYTKEASLCIITHVIQRNQYYNFINHPEWKDSTMGRILRRVIKAGPSFALLLIKQSFNLYRHRKDWVKMTKDITSGIILKKGNY